EPYGASSRSKYRDELVAPVPSRGGEEIGLSRATADHSLVLDKNRRDAEKKIARLKPTDAPDPELQDHKNRLSRMRALIYSVLGAAISVAISELDAKPFPSTKLLFSGAIVILMAILVAVENW